MHVLCQHVHIRLPQQWGCVQAGRHSCSYHTSNKVRHPRWHLMKSCSFVYVRKADISIVLGMCPWVWGLIASAYITVYTRSVCAAEIIIMSQLGRNTILVKFESYACLCAYMYSADKHGQPRHTSVPMCHSRGVKYIRHDTSCYMTCLICVWAVCAHCHLRWRTFSL